MSADTIEELPESKEPKKGGGSSSIVQAVIVVVIICLVNFAITYFVLIPSLKPAHAEEDAHGEAASSHAVAESSHGAEAASSHDKMHQYPFEPITANLHSPYKSRLIKIQFTAAGQDPKFEQKCEENIAKLKDASLGVLQSLTLLDTQDPGIRNTIKARLVNEFEKAMNGRIIQEVYITDMVIQ